MIEDARNVIQTEKKAALAEMKHEVAKLSLEIAEKLLRKNLSDEKSQRELVDKFIKEIKVN